MNNKINKTPGSVETTPGSRFGGESVNGTKTPLLNSTKIEVSLTLARKPMGTLQAAAWKTFWDSLFDECRKEVKTKEAGR